MGTRTEWRRVEGWRGACSLVIEWGSIAGVIWLASRLDAIAAYVAAVVLVGALQHRLAALGHEAAHGLLLPSRFWNDALAEALCFFPLLGTIRHYRRWHLAHHASPNDPERDPDELNLGPWLLRGQFPMSRGRMAWPVFGRWLSAPISFVRCGFVYMLISTFGMGEGLRSVVPHHRWYPPRVELLARLAFYAALALALAASGPVGVKWFVALWVVPLATTFPYFLMLRDTFQHANADMGRFTNRRVFRVSPAVRWAVFPYGQDLHLPHHASPSVPHYGLEAFHRHLLASRSAYGPAVVECRGVLRNRTGEPTIADVLMRGRRSC